MLQSTEKSEPKRDGDGSSSMSSADLQPPASQSWSSSSTTGILSSPLVFHVCWLLPHTAITALQLKVFSVHTFVFLVCISFHCMTSLNRPSLQGIKYVFYCACWTFGRNVSRMMHKTFRSLMFDADVLFQSLMCHCSVTGVPTLYWSQALCSRDATCESGNQISTHSVSHAEIKPQKITEVSQMYKRKTN